MPKAMSQMTNASIHTITKSSNAAAYAFFAHGGYSPSTKVDTTPLPLRSRATSSLSLREFRHRRRRGGSRLTTDNTLTVGATKRRSAHMAIASRVLMLAVVVYVTAFAIRIVARRYYIFLPDYARWTFADSLPPRGGTGSPTHVMFLFADHFEPGHDAAGTRKWIARYRALADRHRDRSGRRLQHTWFYPGEQHLTKVLAALRDPVREGYGEVELHYHHHFDSAD